MGLDRATALAALDAGIFAEVAAQDVEQAAQLEIRGVPFFVFYGKYALSGVQSIETFTSALDTA
jgi:predicted DsbA family dithiol-disulfide isomerase